MSVNRMNNEYLVINKKILPDYYEKVIEARELIDSGKCNVSDAVKQVGISRSTYYKFKDYVFLPVSDATSKKAVINCMLAHKQGVLSEVLNELSKHHANILTINQSIPIHNHASVSLSLDIADLRISIDELIGELKGMDGVSSVKLVAFD